MSTLICNILLITQCPLPSWNIIRIRWQGMHGKLAGMNESMSEDKWMMNESINCILWYILSTFMYVFLSAVPECT